SVVPLIDMRRRFDLPAEDHPQRKIIVMSVEGRVVGMMVDGVTEVVRVPRSDIRPAPELFTEVQAPFFMGICEYRGRTLVLLNVKNVVASEDEIVLPDTSVILGAEG
ncbi:MAG: chemotaxis protein CheW, partial [Myxococcota bacterium]